MTHINQRRDTAANWSTINPVLQLGEVGWEKDTRKSKLGDGTTAWNSLLYTKSGSMTAADVGLDQVDNTADIDKPVSTAQQALIVDSIADGDTTHAPSRNAVFDALADQTNYADSLIVDDMSVSADGDTTHAPSRNAVYDALAALSMGLAVTGVVTPYAGSSAPTGWLLCDGSAVNRTTYAALFAVVGTAFGAGDGSTTFNLPNLMGRVPVGRDSGQSEFDTLGETGGEKKHTLTINEMPAHDHNLNRADGVGGSLISIPKGDGTTAVAGDAIASAGGGAGHNNLQPYITLNYIVKT